MIKNFFKKYSFLFLTLFPATLRSQTPEIDSLLRAANHIKAEKGSITKDTSLINCYLLLSNEYFDEQDRNKEQEYTNKALALILRHVFRKGNSFELSKYLIGQQATCYGNIASYYDDLNKYPKAFQYHFKALKLNESIKNKTGILRDLTNIGLCYGESNEHIKALEYNLRALNLAKELNENNTAILYGNISAEYHSLKKYNTALTYDLKSLSMYQKQKDTLGIQMMLGNIGIDYKSLGDVKRKSGSSTNDIPEYLTAAVYYEKALRLSEITKNKLNRAINLTSLGSLFNEINKAKDAEPVLQESLKLSTEISDLYGVMLSNELLSDCYTLLGKPEKALEHYKKHIEAKDSIFNEENTKKNLEEEVNFKFEKKEAIQKAEYEKHVIALEAQNRIQKNTRNFIIIISILAVLLVASGFVYHNNKATLKLRELHAQQLLIAQDEEKRRISKELHDSIGQNILFIKNQLIKQNELRLMPQIDETLEEVRNISKDLYPNQLEKYGIVAAVEALAEKVRQSSDIFVSYDLEGFDRSISQEKQINYYRIIQECISNTVKHSEATALRITASGKNDIIELVIQDNGKGFNKSILIKKAQHSFGMLNIEERIKSLNGRYDLETAPGKGTKHIFIIPE